MQPIRAPYPAWISKSEWLARCPWDRGPGTWKYHALLKLDLGKLLGCEKQCVGEKCCQGSSFDFRIHVCMNSALSFPQHI